MSVPHNKKLFESEKSKIEALYSQGLSIADIAVKYGMSYAPMQRFFKRNGIAIRSLKEAKVVSSKTCEGLEKWRVIHGSWNKGLSIDDPRIKRGAEKGRKTQIKNGKSRGKNNPMYGKAPPPRKRGFRKDLNHFVRSSWEANFARILIHLSIPYEYEKHTFSLKAGDSYTPDFFLPSKKTFYEIKGFDYNDKHLRFVQEYSHLRLKLVDEKLYTRFIRWFSSHICFDSADRQHLTTQDITTLFTKYCNSCSDKPTASGFCKTQNFSPKLLIRIYGSSKKFLREHQNIIDEAELQKLVSKYLEFRILNNKWPTRREIDNYYSRSSSLRSIYFNRKHKNIIDYIKENFQ